MSKKAKPKYALQFTEKQLSHLHNSLRVYEQLSLMINDGDDEDPETSIRRLNKWDDLGKMIKSVEKVLDSID
jgi:16S rRNA U1498 N3-methylase RsmE